MNLLHFYRFFEYFDVFMHIYLYKHGLLICSKIRVLFTYAQFCLLNMYYLLELDIFIYLFLLAYKIISILSNDNYCLDRVFFS